MKYKNKNKNNFVWICSPRHFMHTKEAPPSSYHNHELPLTKTVKLSFYSHVQT